MEKKILKFYVSPATEAVEVELEGHLLDASIEKPHWSVGGARETLDFEEDEE